MGKYWYEAPPDGGSMARIFMRDSESASRKLIATIERYTWEDETNDDLFSLAVGIIRPGSFLANKREEADAIANRIVEHLNGGRIVGPSPLYQMQPDGGAGAVVVSDETRFGRDKTVMRVIIEDIRHIAALKEAASIACYAVSRNKKPFWRLLSCPFLS